MEKHMGKQVKSARGEIVDFDLIKIKEQIASAPPPVDVKQRQDFVEKRLRRRIKKEINVTGGGQVEVEPKLPKDEEVKQEESSGLANNTVDTTDEKVESTQNVTPAVRQKARPKKQQKKTDDK